jgi:hypothetical protein
LKQTTLKISESIEEKITEIQKVVNDDLVTLNGISEKMAEMIMKVNKFNVVESLLKENIIRLSYELKEKSVEVSERTSELDKGL